MKNTLDGINGQLDMAERSISEFEYIAVEIFQKMNKPS